MLRDDQGVAQDLLQDQLDPKHFMKATALWRCPTIKSASGARQVLAWIVNDWQLSGVWTGATGTPYSATFTTRTAEAM